MKTKVFLGLFLLLFNINYSQVPSYIPSNGLVGYWPFNGNANDESGNGNNGTVNGATLTTDRFGNSDKAYDFNGSSNYIRINNSTSLNSTSVSISGWFNTNNLATNDYLDAKGIIGKWWQTSSVCNSNYNAYLVCLTKPLSQTSTFVGGATSFYEGNVFYANTPISTNNWYHFVFVHDSASGGSLYINGNLVNSNSSFGSICNSLNALNIGADINNGNLYRFFNGKIDDIGIWNRVLSPQEILALYNGNNCLAIAPTGNSYQTLCANSTLNDVQVTGSNIQYYDAQTGGNLLPNTATLINGQIVYASQTINGCESNDRLAITININDPQIVASSTNVCVGTSVNLTASTTSSLASNCALPSNLQNGLVGYWPFCGNANDTSGNGNNGTVNEASLTTDRFGNTNSAYSFDGLSNYIQVPHNSTFDFETTNSITISTWIKTTMNNGAIFVQKQSGVGGTQNGVSCGILDSNGYLHGVSKKTNGIQSLISNLAFEFNNDNWHSFVYSFSSGISKLYLDGFLLCSQTNSGSIVANSTTNLIFGYGLPLNNFYFKGKLDDIGIWNKALTEQEIQQLYIQGQTTYLWSTGEITASINPSPNTTTTYWCDVTTNGVTCHKEITITVNQPLNPTFNQVASVCEGNTITPLPTSSNENISGNWSPAINNTASTTYTFTPDFGQCASASTMTIEVNPNIIPTFNQIAPICSGTNLHVLPSSSLEGILGIWSPMIDSTTTTTYTFTPTSGQCALSNQMTIVVNPNVIPTFNQIAPICMGTQLNDLPTISIENITGLWSPSIDNNVTTTYTFTPTIGQCALSNQMTIVVNPNITPTFNQVAPICNGTPIDALPNISNENISGSWSPTIDNSNTTTYLFTPTTGQCAIANQMTIVVYPVPTMPSGASNQSYNDGDTLSNLAITGTNLNWYDSQSSDTPINISTPLVNGTTYYVSQTINGCEGPRLAVTVTLTLSLNQNQIFNLSYNPNPVEDMLWIKSNNIIKNISVYNLLGQLLLSDIKETNEFNIDISNLPSSNYFIKVETENSKQIFKIIKK